jgi:hypothetical protein
MRNVDSRLLRSVTLVLGAATVCATAAVASPAAGPASRIVFAANRAAIAYGEVYRVNPDGSRVDLSNSPAPDIPPAVSPDGMQIAFVSSRGGRLARLAWSPDAESGPASAERRPFQPAADEGRDEDQPDETAGEDQPGPEGLNVRTGQETGRRIIRLVDPR